MSDWRKRMRLMVAGLSSIGLAVSLTIGPIPVEAGIRPSFSLEDCSWNATHIVLVQTTADDAVFSVLESWKGDLRPGSSVTVPELKPGRGAVSISTLQHPEKFASQGMPVAMEQIPKQPVGSRMILFLKSANVTVANPRSAENGIATRWEPVPAFGGMKVSALWINGRTSFCFRQWMNPGPSALSECNQFPETSSDLAVLTSRIRRVLQMQTDLAETSAMEGNPEVRADRLGHIALSDVRPARVEALDALGKSGVVAVPEILQVIDSTVVPNDGDAAMGALVAAAGKNCEKLLHAKLQEDLIYWKAIGPTLTTNWLDQLMEPGAALFIKFHGTELLIRELDREHYVPAAKTVAELHDFWVSQSHLYDPKWGERDLSSGGTALEMLQAEAFGLAKHCEDFLKHVSAELLKPKYERPAHGVAARETPLPVK
jgi:hypothetical protein